MGVCGLEFRLGWVGAKPIPALELRVNTDPIGPRVSLGEITLEVQGQQQDSC